MNKFIDILKDIGFIIGIILFAIAIGYYFYIQVTEDIARRDAMQAITRKLNSGEPIDETDVLIVKTSLDNANARNQRGNKK